MTAKTTLNTKNLESLGAARLAELLVKISGGDAAAKRLLRLVAGEMAESVVRIEITDGRRQSSPAAGGSSLARHHCRRLEGDQC